MKSLKKIFKISTFAKCIAFSVDWWNIRSPPICTLNVLKSYLPLMKRKERFLLEYLQKMIDFIPCFSKERCIYSPRDLIGINFYKFLTTQMLFIDFNVKFEVQLVGNNWNVVNFLRWVFLNASMIKENRTIHLFVSECGRGACFCKSSQYGIII